MTKLGILALSVAAVLTLGTGFLLVGCGGGINVMGRGVSDQEYFEGYDAAIAREKQHLEPAIGHDEYGRIPSWDQYWCTAGGTTDVPATARSRRLKRYIVAKRREAGLRELTNPGDYVPSGRGLNGAPGSFRPDRFFPKGDPRIFQ